MNTCLVCRYESYATEGERTTFLNAVLLEADANPTSPVIVCDAHFADMALLTERLGDVL